MEVCTWCQDAGVALLSHSALEGGDQTVFTSRSISQVFFPSLHVCHLILVLFHVVLMEKKRGLIWS